MTCAPCRKTFTSWRRFKRHCLEAHRINEANLVRRYAQLVDPVEVVLVQSASGKLFLFGQGPLL